VDHTERAGLIEAFAAGPARLREALKAVPAAAMQWRPALDGWSVHEIVIHCADSETMAAGRIRTVAVEPDPLIVGYDQERWAREFNYHELPVEMALLTVEAVRANTVPLLRRLPDTAWARVGRHTESGHYSAQDWLRTYARHLHDHAEQIERNVRQWQQSHGREH
jgi:hypothetical protein